MSLEQSFRVKKMQRFIRASVCVLLCLVCAAAASAQKSSRGARGGQSEFGPIVRAYLGYLQSQQEVVDDRVSRREVDHDYYVRNSNRIHALRAAAIRYARQTRNDYLPELEAVAADEFKILFDEAPDTEALRVGEVLNYQFRYLGAQPSGRDKFYVFARLDPYEQAELRKKGEAQKETPAAGAPAQTPAADSATTRPRRAVSP
jgi:hypothetical protein